MKKFLENHVSITMFLSAWIAWPICVYIFHNITIVPYSWNKCLVVTTQLIAFSSVVCFLMGCIIDSANRDKLKREFLRKLES